MARENRLWSFLRDGLRGTPGLHMRRVENLASTGDPDVDGCYNGRYFEIELKGANRPKRGGPLDYEVRASQVVWHRRRLRAGGNTWLYIRVGEGRDTRKYLIWGSFAPALQERAHTEAELAELAVLPPTHSPAELLARVVCGGPVPIV